MHIITVCPICHRDFMYHASDRHLERRVVMLSLSHAVPICQECHEQDERIAKEMKDMIDMIEERWREYIDQIRANREINDEPEGQTECNSSDPGATYISYCPTCGEEYTTVWDETDPRCSQCNVPLVEVTRK